MIANRIILLLCVFVLIFLCGRAESHDEKLSELWEMVSTLNFCGDELNDRK